MTDTTFSIKDPAGKAVPVTLRRDRRLKKSARWQREPDGSILLRVPYQMPRKHLRPLLRDVEKSLRREQHAAESLAARRTDADLQARAEYINRTYFDDEIELRAIRWVGNMNKRLGSCTSGGPTDGHIRISDRIRSWPQWVVDYVIAHEMAHRLHPNHSDAFWTYLSTRYPLTEKARGFIEGVSYARGEVLSEDEN